MGCNWRTAVAGTSAGVCLSRAASTANQRRLMSDAMQAAPNPLSMLTTATLGEQVFNMPSNAATPPNDAP